MIYKPEDVLKIAKRFNNKKRSFLLVNPLQGKHLPVSPAKSLEMMKSLGEKIKKNYPDTKLVIGFAETATAIGAMVTNSLCDCIYLQTTRENLPDCIEFLEEHSHAPEQKIYAKNLAKYIAETKTVIFVDDEISTGKTLRNIVKQLKTQFPILNEKKLVAASILNRLSNENLQLLQNDNISCEYLVKISDNNFNVEDINIEAPKILPPSSDVSIAEFHKIELQNNPRFGVNIQDYINELNDTCKNMSKFIDSTSKSVLILGTEECMIPAIFFGKTLEDRGFKVYTHSTTRSPIGICQNNDYPIFEGFQLKSFYDENRITFIYNLRYYDWVIVISDVKYWNEISVKSLISALNVHGCNKIIFFGG